MPNDVPTAASEGAQTNESQAAINQNVSFNLSHLVGFCALGLLACFFLPWISFLFGKVSGFDFTKSGGLYLSLWAIPVFCILTFFAGVTKTSQQNAAIFTGLLPFVALAVGLADIGPELFKVLEIGGYGSLIFGLLLVILPSRLK